MRALSPSFQLESWDALELMRQNCFNLIWREKWLLLHFHLVLDPLANKGAFTPLPITHGDYFTNVEVLDITQSAEWKWALLHFGLSMCLSSSCAVLIFCSHQKSWETSRYIVTWWNAKIVSKVFSSYQNTLAQIPCQPFEKQDENQMGTNSNLKSILLHIEL